MFSVIKKASDLHLNLCSVLWWGRAAQWGEPWPWRIRSGAEFLSLLILYCKVVKSCIRCSECAGEVPIFKCQLYPLHYTRVCFLVMLTQLKRARSASGSSWSQSRHTRGGGDDFPCPPSGAQAVRAGESTCMGTQLPGQAQVLCSSLNQPWGSSSLQVTPLYKWVPNVKLLLWGKEF